MARMRTHLLAVDGVLDGAVVPVEQLVFLKLILLLF